MMGLIIVSLLWMMGTACQGTVVDGSKTVKDDPVSSPVDLEMDCTDGVLLRQGAYTVENNTWGKGSLAGWSQCVGIGPGPGNVVAARFTWDWLNTGDNVKAYPECIFGQKPGMSSSSTTLLPKRIRDLQEVLVRYDVSSQVAGKGNVAFDLWLTNTDHPATFGVPPITHEIMVWLQSFGSMVPGGTFREQRTIGGVRYDVYVGENFGGGWRYIAFQRVDPALGADSLDLGSVFTYTTQANLISGDEYLASVEFGNEIISGTGETRINAFEVRIH